MQKLVAILLILGLFSVWAAYYVYFATRRKN